MSLIYTREQDNIFFNSMLISIIFHISLFIFFPYLRYQLTEKPPLKIIQVDITDFGTILRHKIYSPDKRIISPKEELTEKQSQDALVESENPNNQTTETLKMTLDISQPFFKENRKNLNILDLTEEIKTPQLQPEDISSNPKKIDLTASIKLSNEKQPSEEIFPDNLQERKITFTKEDRFLENISTRDKNKSNLVMPVPENLNLPVDDDAFKVPNEIKGYQDKYKSTQTLDEGIDNFSSGIAVSSLKDDINLPAPNPAGADKIQSLPEGIIPLNQGDIVDKNVGPEVKRITADKDLKKRKDRAIIYEPETKMPAWAEKQGINTKFKARILIAPKGDITEVRLITKTGFAELDNLAIEHIKKILYEPYYEYTERLIEVELITK
ncbi:MAG: energy transducer TonB [Candidatus Hydrogenedentota bacterium]